MRRFFAPALLFCVFLTGCNLVKSPGAATPPESTAPEETGPGETQTAAAIRVLVEPSLDFVYVDDFHEGLAKVRLGDKFGFVDRNGAVVVPIVYDHVEPFSDGVAEVRVGEWNEAKGDWGAWKCGYVDKAGNVVVPTEYDAVGTFHDGLAWVVKDGKYGYVDKTGVLVVPLIYDTEYPESFYDFSPVPDFSEGLAAVDIGGKCGFLDTTGALAIPAEFDGGFFIGEWISYLPMFREGLARVQKDGKYGYIDRIGRVAVPFEYEYAGDYWGYFSEGLSKVYKDGKQGFIDKTGTVIVPLEYGFCMSFNGGLAFVTTTFGSNNVDTGSYIDKTGRPVVPFKFNGDGWSEWLYPPAAEGLIVASKGGKRGCLDAAGNTVIPFEFYDLRYCADGLWFAAFEVDTYGLVDRTGTPIPLPEGCEVILEGYAEGRVLVRMGFEKYGFTDVAGNLAVPLVYDNAQPFSGGFAAVSTGPWASRAMGYVDRDGNIALPLEYDEVTPFSEGLAWIKQNGKWGIVEIH